MTYFPTEVSDERLYPNIKTRRVTEKPIIIHGLEAKKALSKALLPLYTPKQLYNDVQSPSKIYYRVYKSRSGYAVFLLYEWPFQTLPPHKYDYEPVIVLMDKNMKITEIYTDGFHYYIKKNTPPVIQKHSPHIEITAPWRSMKVEWTEPSENNVMVYPVDELKGVMYPTSIRYLSENTLSELRSRDVNPLTVNDKLIRNPWTVRKAEHWETYNAPSIIDLIKDLAKNYGIRNYKTFLLKIEDVVETLKEKATSFINKIKGDKHEETREEDSILVAG